MYYNLKNLRRLLFLTPLFIPFVTGILFQKAFTSSYQTVIASAFSSTLFLIILLTYLFLKPKKKLSLALILLAISLLPVISLFRPGSYESGDFNLHIYRIMSFYDSFVEGNLMPSWAAGVNASYGNPIFIFNYSLPYYLVSILHFTGLSFVTSMKILLGSTFIVSGIFMFFAMRKILRNELAAFTAAIFYLFNPYHLVDIHFRATPGESTLFMIIPLHLYCVISFLKTKKIIPLIGVSITVILLAMSHPMVSLPVIFFVMVFSYVHLGTFKKNRNTLFFLTLAILVGLIASLYIWAPFVIYRGIMFPNPSNQQAFINLSNLLYSPYKFGLLFQGPNGELVPTIGFSQLLTLVVGLALLLKKPLLKKFNTELISLMIFFGLFFFLMLPISEGIWKPFRMLWMLSDRLLLPLAVISSMIAGYTAYKLIRLKYKYFLYFIIIFAILSTILNWGHRRVIPNIDDNWLRLNLEGSTSFLEGSAVFFANTKWADKEKVWFENYPNSHLEVIKGQGEIKQLRRLTTEHSYILNAKTDVTLKENTLWYPGWNLRSNYNDIAIFPGKYGVINAKLPKGLHFLEFKYSDIPIYKNLKYLGFSIFCGLILVLIFSVFSRHPKYFTWKFDKPSFFNKE